MNPKAGERIKKEKRRPLHTCLKQVRMHISNNSVFLTKLFGKGDSRQQKVNWEILKHPKGKNELYVLKQRIIYSNGEFRFLGMLKSKMVASPQEAAILDFSIKGILTLHVLFVSVT